MSTDNPIELLRPDIEALRTWASGRTIVNKIWLFGSRVRGTHRPDSDLDIAIEHGIKPGDSDMFTTGLCEPEVWKDELKVLVRFVPDVQSYIPGDTPTVEAGLKESSVLIYEKVA